MWVADGESVTGGGRVARGASKSLDKRDPGHEGWWVSGAPWQPLRLVGQSSPLSAKAWMHSLG
jgi:hypothetical protein